MMLYLILNQEARTRRTDRRTAIASATMVMNASTVHAKFLLHRFQYHSIRRQNFKNSPTAINHVVWFQGLKLIFRCDFDFWGLGFWVPDFNFWTRVLRARFQNSNVDVFVFSFLHFEHGFCNCFENGFDFLLSAVEKTFQKRHRHENMRGHVILDGWRGLWRFFLDHSKRLFVR